MKVRLFSDEFPSGLEADWPAIPRAGETVSFSSRNGLTNLNVGSVRWLVEADGTPIEVAIQLTV